MNDLISVIIPVYNVERYLHRCIDSVIHQTYYNLEIILVDDGSTDASSGICDKYKNLDKRIVVIHKENSGAAAAKNIGINFSSGNYITFVDSDDYIELNMYEEMMKINQKYDCDVILCDCLKENTNLLYKFPHSIRGGYYDKEMLLKEYYPSLLITKAVNYPPSISNCAMLIKKEILEKKSLLYKEDMRFSEDWLFGSQVMYYANSFYYMKDIYLYHYMMNENSVTHTYYENKWNMMCQLHNYVSDFFLTVNDYDFEEQVNLALLYVVYHCIGNIKNSIDKKTAKIKKIFNILSNKKVKAMFLRLKINSLNISWKLKIYTYMYKLFSQHVKEE